ncbi:MAG TPA: flavin reductase family protein [Dehalococcoidia bacterium]|nr:flavin reductase family protein [Dehalococcoidia bacterium]
MGQQEAMALTSLLWGPVVVVTSRHGERRSGQIAISCISASIVPGRPRVQASLWKLNLTHDLVVESGALALHILRRDQVDRVKHFGLQSGRQADKFADLAWQEGGTGAPILTDSLGWLEGRVVNAMDGGDMTTFLVDITDGGLRGEAAALMTWEYLRNNMDDELKERNETRRRIEEAWNREHLDQFSGPFFKPQVGAGENHPRDKPGAPGSQS